ncbi:MAG: hypothetical protein KJ904_00575 [Alphaproteobacteria bacterium]|nr:hypothetical protein [Alphaproteobacteria bacterium]MBU0797574.1 hypothetical protein [Alphaproteobacteria bacterium]MBU0885638.1 hypothetical protein [Alphaproteobacteria bacterium]MBU1812706.1 hypothetical protein [Alphaproteobacteria bacterium]MBU2090095.1 hypothetical protein [Alphaproteobacteria bacterium]
MTLSADDLKELQYSIQRMNSVAAVFRMRAENTMNPRFFAFATMIDTYLDCCQHSMTQGRDFIRDGLVISAEDKAQMQEIMNEIFTGDPATPPDAEGKK